MNNILDGYSVEDDHVLVVVSAKEEGKIYELQDGTLTFIEGVVEHPPQYSDNEGFFERRGRGITMGSGNVREEADEHNLLNFLKRMAQAVTERMNERTPRAVLVLEPEHLHGKFAEYVTPAMQVPVVTVQYGNFMHESISALETRLKRLYSDDYDPSDPGSVAGEENAEEKRKLLEVAQRREG